ncbi:AadA family aminoglycoside 3''-O-nucleotidyltransferase [Herminiimonas arsenitoxidans]|uniref:AadA family aminoglycoside 3''-O-nucleotidyltransferase n=1 Tax=Herminiimonas arsenitoxidans TaxID=1809410 RepID=UPI0009710DA7|nr:AadA family aminoglycoside 3''-O-nucleotidyltransferase [Herminiimonas arsenitoxidans]
MNTTPPVEITQQLSNTRAILEHHLAGSLQAIHLFGSAIDGGLKPHSDIDLLVTVSTPPTESTRRSLMMELLTVSAWPGSSTSYRPLEVTVIAREEVIPWRYPARRELQFGEWLREELQAGIIEPAMLDHDLAILLTKARQHSVCLMGIPATEFFDPVPREDFAKALSDTIAQWNEASDWQGDEQTVVLALARIWFSVSTGKIAPKDIAAAWALERLPEEYRPVLAKAQAAYLHGAADELADDTERMSPYVHYVKTMIQRA